jgi:hypothetical protein
MLMDLFNASDGSKYRIVTARWLSQVAVWKGNRVIDMTHVDRIREGLKGNIPLLNANPFRLAFVKEDNDIVTRYIIDGQHRHHLLKEYFQNPASQDFNIIVAAKQFSNEDEIIDYFKMINTTKSIPWKEDPVLCANTYISAIMKQFNTDPKFPLIRAGKTKRPFMSADKLREALIAKRVYDWKKGPVEFAEECIAKNDEKTEGLKLKETLTLMESKALEYQFALAMDDSFSWI